MNGLKLRPGLPLWVLFVAPALYGCGGTPDPSGPIALVNAWVEMWNAYDLDRVGELFLTDERPTYFSSEREGVIRGFEALMDHHRGFGFVSGGVDQGSRLWVEGLRSQVFDDVAILTGIWFFRRGPETGGREDSASESVEAGSQPPPQRGPVTFVCVYEEGAWRFAHMNFGEYLPEESAPGS